ncbi:SLIT-ROBO Rho GTPase-activating protein 1-like isoform X2 [Watersipora subatra]|uniref:SLIT-ROBO Rho GTPase-activating protein 1-like isoform X2 n=1 Tax=Watersipora subatra TaxID=2589382 RepID=UPI00355BF4FF
MPIVGERRSVRKEKEQLGECEQLARDIQGKLQAQLRCLDDKLENQSSMVSEIQEFFKKRAEIEFDYSQRLEKLARQCIAKQKQEKLKRESWMIMSTYTCWQHIIGITKQQSRDHSVLSDVYGNAMFQRLADINEDSRRLFCKSKEAALTSHDEIYKVLNELQSDMKEYHVYNSQAKQAEAKLKTTEALRVKVEQQASQDSRRLKTLDKQREKRQGKYTDNKLKALQARNKYLLSIDAANAATNKYFVEDLLLLIDCMDFGYHNAMQRSMLLYKSCLENMKNSHQTSMDCMVKCVQELDHNKDKQSFQKCNSGLFSLPKKFEYQPHRGDEVSQVSAQKPVQDELVHRYQQLHNRLDTLRLENEETWKSVEAVDKHMMGLLSLQDYDVTSLFKSDQAVYKPSMQQMEARKRRIDSEKYYFEKFKSYLLDSNLIARLQVKHATLQKALGEDASHGRSGIPARPPSLPPKPNKQRRIGKSPIVGRPKVFGCNLEEYVEATEEAIPLIIRSCIRAINLYGMHHEGVFRVSGLQAEINEIKASFEKGEDPLADVTDSSSINSIAGVLKLFFRELQEPLFPITLFDNLVASIQLPTVEAVERIKELIHTLSPTKVIIMRYLFSFLDHLAQYSDENRMYPYNLAICFGPTLLTIPHEDNQVMHQNSVNDLVKLIIVHSPEIFPKEEPGPHYERILLDPGIAFIRQTEAKFVTSLSQWSKAYRASGAAAGQQWPSYKTWLSHENIRSASIEISDRDEADGSENEHSDDDADAFEATAAFDYEGRTEGELSFKQGDTLLLYNQKSADWWEGVHEGKAGFIPDRYIHFKQDDVSAPTTPSCTGSLPNRSLTSAPLPEGSPKVNINKRRSDSQLQLPALESAPDSGQLAEKCSSQPDIPSTSSGSQLSLQLRLPPTKEIIEPGEIDVPLVRTASNESLSDQSEHSRKSTPSHSSAGANRRPSVPRAVIRKVEKETEFSDEVTTYLKPAAVDSTYTTSVPLDTMVSKPITLNSPVDADACDAHRKESTASYSSIEENKNIDKALAEVMSNLQTMRQGKVSDDILEVDRSVVQEPASPPPTRCTPDLVQDLPLVDSTSDSSPVGSYNEPLQMPASPPAVTSVVDHANNHSELESVAETFANSDGTIIRIKSNTELQRAPAAIKFITPSFSRPRELSSFKRSLSTSSANSPKEESSTPVETIRVSGKVQTVTGNPIQVKAPSIPSHLDLLDSRKTQPLNNLVAEESTDASQSLPSTPASGQLTIPFPSMSKSTDSSNASELLAVGVQKFKKPPPPIKAKPKPPAPPPKPKK